MAAQVKGTTCTFLRGPSCERCERCEAVRRFKLSEVQYKTAKCYLQFGQASRLGSLSDELPDAFEVIFFNGLINGQLTTMPHRSDAL